MANTTEKFTMQGDGTPVSAAGQGGKADPQASSSSDRSSVEVATLASPEYKATSSRTHRHEHDNPKTPYHFCYVCGSYTPPHGRKNITHVVNTAYKYCFSLNILNQDKNWVPHIVYLNCHKMLITCYNNKDLSNLKYSAPVKWTMPESKEDCFFCRTITHGFNRKSKSKIKYIYTDKVVPPVLILKHRGKFKDTVAEIEGKEDIDMQMSEEEVQIEESDSDMSSDEGSGSDGKQSKRNKEPQKFTQNELSDLGRELGLSKEAHELLASRLKQKNLLEKGAKISIYRTRELEFRPFFTKDESVGLVYCNDIVGLMNNVKADSYRSNEWRLFIDSSIRSLKVILLHNTNILAPIPIAHSTVLKESYENIKIVLEKIKYKEHQWRICGDLKIIGILLGMQSGNIKYPCFLCLFDSRDRQNHYIKKDWPKRSLQPGSFNVIQPPLVNTSKILIPPLHLKLGFMKQFVTALDKDGNCFKYIVQKMHKLSEAKLKAGIFDGPQIRTLFKDVNFTAQMTDLEEAAWTSFRAVSENFLGNNKSQNYQKLVSDMIENYKNLGCNMSIKLHFVDSHLDFFPDKLGDFSEEQGERCHQDMKDMEKRYQGTWGISMMADYCWNLKRDVETVQASPNRKSLRRSFEDKRVRYHKRTTGDG